MIDDCIHPNSSRSAVKANKVFNPSGPPALLDLDDFATDGASAGNPRGGKAHMRALRW